MLNLLIKPLLGVAGDVVTGIVETKKKKAEVKLKKIEAEAAHMDKVIAGEAEWESAAVKQMAGSWKDEVSLVVLLLPAVLVFVPGCQDFVKNGFVALQELPTYYQNLLYIAISASFGIKGAGSAVKLFKK
jgi:hypothetical protein|tara:strand:- start:1517 stop:1906 length:390 start_codon:yes stop_codon:yes gene_type:complete